MCLREERLISSDMKLRQVRIMLQAVMEQI